MRRQGEGGCVFADRLLQHNALKTFVGRLQEKHQTRPRSNQTSQTIVLVWGVCTYVWHLEEVLPQEIQLMTRPPRRAPFQPFFLAFRFAVPAVHDMTATFFFFPFFAGQKATQKANTERETNKRVGNQFAAKSGKPYLTSSHRSKMRGPSNGRERNRRKRKKKTNPTSRPPDEKSRPLVAIIIIHHTPDGGRVLRYQRGGPSAKGTISI
ncbi:hypothetical protein LZ32DRAFT_77202 [Colletotrichum eremochloae]|nr:hypothetical protein LZ32DRAFT_77202 [Colletotrichum eremochloae]